MEIYLHEKRIKNMAKKKITRGFWEDLIGRWVFP